MSRTEPVELADPLLLDACGESCAFVKAMQNNAFKLVDDFFQNKNFDPNTFFRFHAVDTFENDFRFEFNFANTRRGERVCIPTVFLAIRNVFDQQAPTYESPCWKKDPMELPNVADAFRILDMCLRGLDMNKAQASSSYMVTNLPYYPVLIQLKNSGPHCTPTRI